MSVQMSRHMHHPEFRWPPTRTWADVIPEQVPNSSVLKYPRHDDVTPANDEDGISATWAAVKYWHVYPSFASEAAWTCDHAAALVLLTQLPAGSRARRSGHG